MYVHEYENGHVDAHKGQKKGIGSLGTGVLDGCEQPNMGAGNLALVLCKSRKSSLASSHLSSSSALDIHKHFCYFAS